MSTNEKELKELLELLEAKESYLVHNKIRALFPDDGPYRRECYPKHVAFMDAGRTYQERAFVAANRTGKTMTGAYELAVHLTGDYPAWWTGKRFKNAVDAWAAGISNQSTKEIQQFELLGDINSLGTGLIPKDKIDRITKKPGVADAVETVYVKHASGGMSRCTFKSYEQGRISFQGTKKQVIWLDEEPTDPGVYSECLTRLMDKYNPGIIYCTFTPLFGLSDVVLSFLPDGNFPRNGIHGNKYVTNVDWSEVPHLDETQKKNILASYSRHEREARSKGIPSLGAGAIYPYLEENITCEPFPIPSWWSKGYGMDTGWSRTAVIWGAMDPDTKIIYLYSEHYQSEAHPAIHASAIKARGNWMTGASDPAGANLSDGKKIFDMYQEEGLNLVKADKRDREGGILRIGQLFECGQLKIFNTLKNTLSEIRTYRRDEKGEIVKKNDHAMDAMRYFLTTGIDYITIPMDDEDMVDARDSFDRDEYTGY
jgi:phage terminase large subunit-like protein